jgi:Mg2+-importing ATPase
LEKTSRSFWSADEEDLLQSLDSSRNGLSTEEAIARLKREGPNIVRQRKEEGLISSLLIQFKSPIIIILLFSAFLAFALSDNFDGLIIIVIVMSSGLLGFWQERMANNAMNELLSIVKVQATVLRDGATVRTPIDEIVTGDAVILSAGDIIPADSRLMESVDLFVNEASLTGETFPVEKQAGVCKEDSALFERINTVFMGTHVSSGTGKVVVVNTGRNTEFGKIAQELTIKPPATDFELGIRRLGYLLMQMTFIFMLGIFTFNVFFQRPVLDSLLFALALAVGITPQLLPTIVTINLSKGAREMAKNKVIVKKLNAIEDFGTMNILCTDKTGTITRGVMHIESGTDALGKQSDQILDFAYLNAHFQTGYRNPIDQAIEEQHSIDSSQYVKVDEIPYDFIRKRLSVLVQKGSTYTLITKGAVNSILDCCTKILLDSKVLDIKDYLGTITEKYTQYSTEGYRTIGVAYKIQSHSRKITRASERDLIFAGFLVLSDPPKKGIRETLANLQRLGIQVKIITGDNKLIASQIGKSIGIKDLVIMTGHDLRETSDDALTVKAANANIFAEVEPNQKERIVRSLMKGGFAVGFMGDGINDAPAMHAAEVSISVDTAVDVAKDAAEFVLLEKDLNVLIAGVKAGRETFANTIKYIMTTMSANFGNMFSMAGASILLPFLPLLPKQILGINFITDFPGMTIASDNVDSDLIQRPRKWNLKFITRFMLVFGILSTIFDFISFGVLLFVGSFQPDIFRTGWFLLSVITEVMVMLIIRTKRPFYQSGPSKSLLLSSIIVLIVTIALPYTPLSDVLSLQPLSLFIMGILAGIVILYLVLNEVVKRVFYRFVDM